MIERMQRRDAPSAPNALEALADKANRRHASWARANNLAGFGRLAALNLASLPHALRQFPSRYLTHTLVALLLPIALVLGALPLHQAPAPVAAPGSGIADMMLAPAPLALDGAEAQYAQHSQEHGAVIGDLPLDETDALPVPISLQERSDALAPLVVPAMIAGDEVNMRNGPSTAYDETGKLTGGTPIQVLGRSGDWVQGRLNEVSPPFWVSAELIEIAPAAKEALAEITNIPPPPPPKIATVIEEGVNLRDGPGTNYVGLAKMSATQDLTLLQRYVNGSEDWFNVVYGEMNDGWVSAQFLRFQPGVAERVPIITEIPDPNPPLVGFVRENSVNLRKGPGSVYPALGKVNAEQPADLLARHKDWVKVQLQDGTKAWIFSDLIDIPVRVWRRVPATNDIPAPPAPVVRSRRGGGGGGGGGVAAGPLPAPSGDVASYAAQFVGYPYVYGASGPRAFDCSGLTSFVYRQFGIGLPRSSSAQWAGTPGARISDIGSLAPGDLVFFAGTAGPGISHVAIYIGGGQIVHAMTPRYGVQISNLYSSYWLNHYYGAVRPYR